MAAKELDCSTEQNGENTIVENESGEKKELEGASGKENSVVDEKAKTGSDDKGKPGSDDKVKTDTDDKGKNDGEKKKKRGRPSKNAEKTDDKEQKNETTEATKLKNTITTLSTENRKYMVDLRSADMKVKNLNADISKKDSALKDLRSKIDVVTKEKADLSKKLSMKLTELSDKDDEIDDYLKQIDSDSKKASMMERNLKAEITKKENILKDTKDKLDKITKEKADLNDKLDKVNKEKADLSKKLKMKISEINDKDVEIGDYKEKVDEYIEKIDEMTKEQEVLDDYKKKIDEMNQENENLTVLLQEEKLLAASLLENVSATPMESKKALIITDYDNLAENMENIPDVEWDVYSELLNTSELVKMCANKDIFEVVKAYDKVVISMSGKEVVKGKPGKHVLSSFQNAIEEIIKKTKREVTITEIPPTSALSKMADIAILNRRLQELYVDNDKVEVLKLADLALLPKSVFMEADGYSMKPRGYEILVKTIHNMKVPDNSPMPNPPPDHGAGDDEDDDEVETRFIQFDKQYGSVVIGRGGHIVREMQAESNTKICLSSWEDNTATVHYGAFITGLHRDIKVAKEMMAEKINDAKSNKSVSRGMRRAQQAVATGLSPVAKRQK